MVMNVTKMAQATLIKMYAMADRKKKEAEAVQKELRAPIISLLAKGSRTFVHEDGQEVALSVVSVVNVDMRDPEEFLKRNKKYDPSFLLGLVSFDKAKIAKAVKDGKISEDQANALRGAKSVSPRVNVTPKTKKSE